ncbi:MAG: flagellar export chaperone FliS [Firmicutes bacterium]|nr:flagellar export chaperone FliS [Bacillota bacterium]
MILNNTYNKAYNQYRENAIFTSTPEELTLMLYNGLIKFIMQAQAAIDEKDIEKANNSIIRAQEIVLEFQATLDMKYEVSNNLMLLYDYMYRRLMEANIRKDKDILGEVLGFAKELRDIWTQAMKIAKKQSRVKEA